MSVITESGSFYTFNVKYADEPLLLNIEMADFIHDGSFSGKLIPGEGVTATKLRKNGFHLIDEEESKTLLEVLEKENGK